VRTLVVFNAQMLKRGRDARTQRRGERDAIKQICASTHPIVRSLNRIAQTTA
jgi:hypothetical protein